MSYILALDQGTTSSRALVFDHAGTVRAVAQQEFRQIFPQPGLGRARRDRDLGDPVGRPARSAGQGRDRHRRHRGDRHHQPARDHGAVGSRDRAPARPRDRLAGPPHGAASATSCAPPGMPRRSPRKTGLVVDAYFSGTKLKWLLDHVPGARERAARGELAFGTIDSWLIWNLSAGAAHVTDASNATRTMLFNMHTGRWDDDLLALLDIPRAVLPEVVPSSGVVRQRAARGRRRADRRHRRRPAGGAVRPGLPRARARQEHLRHRLLPAAEHRGAGGGVGQQPADHRRLAQGRQPDLRARRQRVHRRRRRAVAARRAEDRPVGRRDRGAGGIGARQRRRLPRPGVRGPRRAALGRLRARHDLRPHPRRDGGAHRARRAGGDRVPERRRAGGDGEGRAASRCASCASTAGRRPTTC